MPIMQHQNPTQLFMASKKEKQRLQESIHTACCDMYEGYVRAISEILPKTSKTWKRSQKTPAEVHARERGLDS